MKKPIIQARYFTFDINYTIFLYLLYLFRKSWLSIYFTQINGNMLLQSAHRAMYGLMHDFNEFL